jgi:hypothetical protein
MINENIENNNVEVNETNDVTQFKGLPAGVTIEMLKDAIFNVIIDCKKNNRRLIAEEGTGLNIKRFDIESKAYELLGVIQ